MTALIRYNTLLMVGIFLFPLLFQPLHVINHHEHRKPGHICGYEQSHDKKIMYDPSTGISEPNVVNQTEEICNICEYVFIINQIPDVLNQVKTPDSYFVKYITPIRTHYLTTEYLPIKLRAPPLS